MTYTLDKLQQFQGLEMRVETEEGSFRGSIHDVGEMLKSEIFWIGEVPQLTKDLISLEFCPGVVYGTEVTPPPFDLNVLVPAYEGAWELRCRTLYKNEVRWYSKGGSCEDAPKTWCTPMGQFIEAKP